MSDTNSTPLTLAELPELRRKTEAVSQHLRQQIAAHLETLRPLLSPERMLGKFAGGKVDVNGAERALAELQQSYRPFTGKPFDLPNMLDANWLTLVGNVPDLYPWEYVHPIAGKPITMTSPVRWAVNYRSNYTLPQVKNILAGKEAARPEYLRQFVVNALVLQSVLTRNPGLTQLFAELRYNLETEKPAELKGLPIMTITSCLSSFRPADDMIQAATAFSGVPAFIELIDLAEAQAPKDALKEQLENLLK